MSDNKPTKKFLMTVSDKAHGELCKIANDKGLSLQELCRIILYQKLGLLPEGEPVI